MEEKKLIRLNGKPKAYRTVLRRSRATLPDCSKLGAPQVNNLRYILFQSHKPHFNSSVSLWPVCFSVSRMQI